MTIITKPELLVTAGSTAEAARFIAAGADALQIGESRYGMRLPGEMKPDDIAETAAIARQAGVKVYASVNNIMDNDILNELPGYLQSLQMAGVDAIIFGDPAVLVARQRYAPELALHWSAEMTSTNYASANYWGRKGASRVILARELNMEQVVETKLKVDMEVQVQVHGMTNIYHSRRNLLESYMIHQGKGPGEAGLNADEGLYLIEWERREERYPVYEDDSGTHIMSSDDICMIDSLHELLEAGIDSLKIEGLMKSAEYNETVVRCYREAIDAYAADPLGYRFQPEWLERIERLQDPRRELSYGFFYKEQVY